MKDIYNKLKKIERPVMLYVESSYGNSRVRVVFPDGSIIFQSAAMEQFHRSCFNATYLNDRKFNSLAEAINQMQKWDRGLDFKIVDIHYC